MNKNIDPHRFSSMISGVINGNSKDIQDFLGMIRPLIVRSCSYRAKNIAQTTHMDIETAADTIMSNYWDMITKDDYKTLRRFLNQDESRLTLYTSKCAMGLSKKLCESIFRKKEDSFDENFDLTGAADEVPTINWEKRKEVASLLIDQLAPNQKKVMTAVFRNLSSNSPLSQNELAKQCGMDSNNFNHNKHLAMANLRQMAAKMGGCQIGMAA